MTSTRAVGSLMQDVPGAFPGTPTNAPSHPAPEDEYTSLSQALHARRAEYVRPKTIRIKVGSWNVAAYKGTEKDVGAWFVQGKGIAEKLTGLKVEEEVGKEDAAHQEDRYTNKESTAPVNDPGAVAGGQDVDLYVLGLQEVVDVNSFTEALRPYTDASVANKWKDALSAALPDGYQLVAEQQLIGMLLLVYAAPDLASQVSSVSTTSVGTGIGGYMGNKGAVTARIVIGETTRLVFVNCHLSAGSDKGALERRNWDAAQIASRTKFGALDNVAMSTQQSSKGESIGEEDFAFWCGDLNYRLEGIPGDDVRRLLMLHTRNEYDLSQPSARKIEHEITESTDKVHSQTSDRFSIGSDVSGSSSAPTTAASSIARSSTESRTSTETAPSTLTDHVAASEDPTSLQTTINSLLPHDQLQQQMRQRKAFHEGWREGPITFLPTYKYDAGSVGIFDSSEKKRAPSWCDRILFRTRRDRLAYEHRIREEEEARKKDEEMRASGVSSAGDDEGILYEYDPETDGDITAEPDSFDEYDERADGAPLDTVVTREGVSTHLELETYTAHQRILSSDHKPLEAIFSLTYEAVDPSLKACVHADVVKELDRRENEERPSVTVVVDYHHSDSTGGGQEERSDSDATTFEGVWFGDVRYGQAKHRTLTIANTGRVPAEFRLISRPVMAPQTEGVAPKWINLRLNDAPCASSSAESETITLQPGETVGIELEVRIFDVRTMHDLNEGLIDLDDVLVLRVDGGRDHFIPVRGRWLDNSLGKSITRLTRIPEGGIRKLQGQRPDSSKGRGSQGADKQVDDNHSSAGGAGAGEAAKGSERLDQLPVRVSAPRELFRLTSAIEGLVGKVIAEWNMTHPTSTTSPRPSLEADMARASMEDEIQAPWTYYAAWPFDADAWAEKSTEQWQESMSQALNALDHDQAVEAALPVELPRMQKLYIISSLLLMFLELLPDGVVDPKQSADIEKYFSEVEKAKQQKPGLDERRGAIQEILATEPSRSISFILLTSMLERVMIETSGEGRVPLDPPTSPSKKRPGIGSFRRMTGLGKVPKEAKGEGVDEEQRVRAFAKVFGDLIVRAEGQAGKDRERRRGEVLELFLRKDGEG